MKVGKISNSDLEKYVFKYIKKYRKEVLTSPNVGIDTAVLDFNNDLIVVSTDPITGAKDNLGNLAINVSCNDVSCQCAEPVGILLTILLPPDATVYELEEIIKDANAQCENLNAEIIGGHTEVTDAVNRIIVSTTVIGKVNKSEVPYNRSIEEKDILVISKFIGIEGMSIIYNEKKEELLKILDEWELDYLNDFSKMLSVVKEASIAKKHNVKYLHDITEGGVFGAVWEISNAMNKNIELDFEKIPVKNITKKIADYYNINLYRLISSGSLLMIFSENDYLSFKKECEKNNLEVLKIGTIKKGSNVTLLKENSKSTLEAPGPDELYKVL